MDDIVVMARVAGAFGIKGWLKLHTYTESPDSLDAYASWLLKGSKGWEEFELEDFAVNAKGAVAKLKGCDDRSAAENLAKRDIGVPRDALEDAGDGEIFWFDLIGCDVINTTGEKYVKENVMSAFGGMWMATMTLVPVGLFLTYKAMHDSQLFNKEFYFRTGRRIKKYFKKNK